MLETCVRGHVVAVLALDRTAPFRDDVGLTELGMDSLMAVELRNRLKQAIRHPLPATVVFEHPTVAALTGHLAEMLSIARVTPRPTSALDRTCDDVAPIRRGGRTEGPQRRRARAFARGRTRFSRLLNSARTSWETMAESEQTYGDGSPLKRALVAIKDLRSRLDEAERAQTAPIAVVGMGCRFPGAPSSTPSGRCS